jgi:hypothetical protein
MIWYRLYRWSDKGITHAWELEAEDEARAVAEAMERLDGARGELWQEKKLVQRFVETP